MKTHEKKKAMIFDEEQVLEFMTKAPNENRYVLKIQFFLEVFSILSFIYLGTS